MDPAKKIDEQQVTSAKFEVGQDDDLMATLASVDQDLGELPDGYGESRIMLMPRDPQWAYAYWDVPNSHKEELRQQGGQQLALRIYDVTDIDINHQAPHSVQEYLCDEMAREWYIPIPLSDRNYVADIGYRCADGRWLVLARSAAISIPPVYPSDWVEDVFITVNWDQDLRGKTLYKLGSPTKGMAATHDKVFNLSQSAEEQRVTGSLFGSMQKVPISSFAFPSGMGMSGVGFSASMPPLRPRKFWMIADAELIVYGATEPDATVTIGGRQIELNPDGTFRFHVSFPDRTLDYPIKAVAKDGEQTRSIHMKFKRETLERNTNTKEEAFEFEQLLLLGSRLTPQEWLEKFKADIPEPDEFQRKVLKKYNEFETFLEKSDKTNSFVQIKTKKVGLFKRNLYLENIEFDLSSLSQEIPEDFIQAQKLVNELLQLIEIQLALYLQLKEAKAIDLTKTSQVSKAITRYIVSVLKIKGKIQEQELDKAAVTIALIVKILQTEDGRKILKLGKQERRKVFVGKFEQQSTIDTPEPPNPPNSPAPPAPTKPPGYPFPNEP